MKYYPSEKELVMQNKDVSEIIKIFLALVAIGAGAIGLSKNIEYSGWILFAGIVAFVSHYE